MTNKIIFREMLSELRELADKQDNHLTKEEVKQFFSESAMNEEQVELVCEYLVGRKIKVDGYEAGSKVQKTDGKQVGENTAEENTADSPKVRMGKKEEEYDYPDFLGMYLEEVAEIRRISDREEERLFLEAAGGDLLAKSALAKQYLETVYELAMTYVASELPVEDLVQEGNIGLLLTLESLEPKASLEEYRKAIFSGIQNAMEEALEISQDTKEMDEEIAGRVNHLNEAILNLEEDLGHKVSPEELSAYLEMPLEEIHDILRMAGDEMKEKQTF